MLATRISARWMLLVGLLPTALAIAPPTAHAADTPEPRLASSWITEQAAKTRVIAGKVELPSSGTRLYAGLEIDLEDGWKTYWRNPGSSGVPPRVDFDGSENLAAAELLFPAPLRFKDRDGDTIGYKKSVILPVVLTPKDPSKPIMLKVAAEFGICREVCIPVQPTMTLAVPSDLSVNDAKGGLSAALSRVPGHTAGVAGAPRIEKIAAALEGAKPELIIEASFPGDAERGDVFLEAPDGIWIPLPQPAGRTASGARRFVVDLTDGADLKELKGRAVRATLVGSAGQSETSFELVESR